MNTPNSGTPLLEMQDIDISFGGVAALRSARLSASPRAKCMR